MPGGAGGLLCSTDRFGQLNGKQRVFFAAAYFYGAGLSGRDNGSGQRWQWSQRVSEF